MSCDTQNIATASQSFEIDACNVFLAASDRIAKDSLEYTTTTAQSPPTIDGSITTQHRPSNQVQVTQDSSDVSLAAHS